MKIFSPKAYDRLYNYVAAHGKPAVVDGVKTLEIINAAFVLRNVRDRIVVHRHRKMNFPFAVAEWISMMTGYSGVDLFTPYIKDYARYSSDGVTIDGAYGQRVHKTAHFEGTQLERLIALLQDSLQTRRAVLSIYDANDLRSGSLNTPCTIALQFLYRNNQLDMITTMRSNDVVRGLTYDLFQFTMLQEYVAAQLGVATGLYYHNAGSMHIYLSDYETTPRYERETKWTPVMRKMPYITQDDLQILLHVMRRPDDLASMMEIGRLSSPYMKDLARSALAFYYRKTSHSIAIKWYRGIGDLTIRRVMRPWLDIPSRVKGDASE